MIGHTGISLMRRWLCMLLSVQLSLVSAPAAFAAAPGEVGLPAASDAIRVTVIGDSLIQETKLGGTVQVEFSNVALEDLGKLDVRTADGKVAFALDHLPKIEVTVFVPKELSDAERDHFLMSVETELNSRYKNPVFRVRELLVPTQEMIQEVNQSERPSPQISEQEWSQAKASTVSMLSQWRQKSKDFARKLKNSRFSSRARDLTVGAMIGVGKSIGSISYWVSVTGLNVYGLAQAAMSIGLDTIFHVFPRQINQWKANHEIPWLKNSSLVQIYNKSPMIKTLIFNQALHFTVTYGFRMLSHLDDPEKVSSPNSVEFLSLFGGMAAIGTPIGAAGDMGVRTLARKGYISGRTEHYIFNLFGLEMQINGLLFGSGRIEWLPIGLGVEWGGKVVGWMLGKILPAKKNRLVIVHPAIAQARKSDALYLMGMEEVIPAKTLENAQMADYLRGHYKLNCESYLN